MEIGNRALLLLGVFGGRLSRVQDQRQDPIEVARPLIQSGDVAIHREFTRAQSNRRLRRREKNSGQCRDGRFFGVRQILAVMEREIVTSRLGIGVDLFEQPRTDVQLVGCPGGIAGLLVQSQAGDRLLCCPKIPLLLVIVEVACGRIEIFRILHERRASIVAELAQILSIAQQIEITLYQLRLPKRLEVLFVNRQSFFDRAAAVLDRSLRPDRKNPISGELFAVILKQAARCGKFSLGNQKLQETSIERWFFRITSGPGAVLSDRDILPEPLSLNHAEDALKCPPALLLSYVGELFRSERRGRSNLGKGFDLLCRTKAPVIEIRQRKLRARFLGGIFDVSLPIGFGSLEIELLFIFKSAEGIEI